MEGQAEKSKRAAAGIARATRGRGGVHRDRTKYDRARSKGRDRDKGD